MKHSIPTNDQGRSTRSSLLRRPAAMRSVMLGTTLLVGGAMAAACGGGSANPSKNGGLKSGSSTKTATVEARSMAKVGKVLVNSHGLTLYMFAPDKQKSVTCTSKNGCSGAWPALVTSGKKPSAGAGVNSLMLGTVKSGSRTVVTYDHWPLYTFVEDSAPGQIKGEGLSAFGGKWYVLSPSGHVVRSEKSGSKSSSGGYGY